MGFSEPVIRLQHVSKRFGPVMALNRVSLEVPRGVVFALLGENGAGKTTAIRVMLGLLEPTEGQAYVLGMPSATCGLAIRRRVGYVAERPTLYEWMTVNEIGWFAAGFYPEGFLPRYYELIRQFNLPAGQRIKTLSKGMRAKVSLALALAHDPELLVLDEPTSGLDALVRREFLESMVDRAATGQTVFLSSHQIAEVERVADIVAILCQGELILVERLDQLKQQVRQVTLTMTNGQVQPPALPGEILWQRRKGRQWQFLLRGVGDAEMSRLARDLSLGPVEWRIPNLEEIFVAYMERGRWGAGAANPEAVL